MSTEFETVRFGLRRMYDPALVNGAKVEWQEGTSLQPLCTGTIVCEDKGDFGQNPFGHYTIRVDMEPIVNYHRACRTASEMHHQTVSRSIDLHKLRLRTSS